MHDLDSRSRSEIARAWTATRAGFVERLPYLRLSPNMRATLLGIPFSSGRT